MHKKSAFSTLYFQTERFDKSGNMSSNRYHHLVLLAENNTGYHNLMKIVSKGFTEGFYYKPRIDLELLRENHEGIIALSACLAGAVPRALIGSGYEKAKEVALEYAEIMGEGNFYLELQDHGIPQQTLVNRDLLRIHQETGIPLVCTNDAHYLRKEDAESHDVLLCIQTGKLVEDEYAQKNLAGATEAGLPIGAYFFSQALSMDEADQEIEYMLGILGDYRLDMPIILDWEIPASDARTANMDARTLTDIQLYFCEKMKALGYQPMVYFNWHQSENLYYLSELEDFPFWLALYQDRMRYPWKVEMWQYTCTGRVPGINGDVDINVYMP